MDKTGINEVVRSLADLLTKAAPLAELVYASPLSSHEHRAALVEQVGVLEYIRLTGILQLMTTRRVWETGQARSAAALRALGLDVDGDRPTSPRDGQAQ